MPLFIDNKIIYEENGMESIKSYQNLHSRAWEARNEKRKTKATRTNTLL